MTDNPALSPRPSTPAAKPSSRRQRWIATTLFMVCGFFFLEGVWVHLGPWVRPVMAYAAGCSL